MGELKTVSLNPNQIAALDFLVNLYTDPGSCASRVLNIVVDKSADLSYSLLSKAPGSIADSCLSLILNAELKKSIYDLTSIGKGSAQISLLGLAGPTAFLYFTSKKIKTNICGIFKSLSALSTGITSGHWTYEANLTNSPNHSKKHGYHISVEIAHEDTFSQLTTDIFMQSVFTAIWGGLAYITQQGMRNAISQATNSQTAQSAINVVIGVIALSQLLPWSQSNTQNSFGAYSQNLMEDYSLIDNNKHTYNNNKPQKKPVYDSVDASNDYEFDSYNPADLAKQREHSTAFPALDNNISYDDESL